MRIFTLLASLLILLTSNLLASPNNEKSQADPLTFNELPEFRVSRGEVLYKRYCLFCHGQSGAGDGMNAFNLPTKPTNFLTDDFRLKPVQQVKKIIMHGGEALGRDKAMPSFRNTLSPKATIDIVTYIRDMDLILIEDESDEL